MMPTSDDGLKTRLLKYLLCSSVKHTHTTHNTHTAHTTYTTHTTPHTGSAECTQQHQKVDKVLELCQQLAPRSLLNVVMAMVHCDSEEIAKKYNVRQASPAVITDLLSALLLER